MNNILERLSKLQGAWKGKGTGKFPTIDSFEYEEQLNFEVNLSYPLIHYEQKTILLPTQEPSLGSQDLSESLMMVLLKYRTPKIVEELRCCKVR